MSPMRTATRVLILATAGILGACHDESPPTGPRAPSPDMPALSQAAQAVSPDPLLAHARAIPGFGGFFLDASGRPTVYLKDAAQRGKAELALAGTLHGLGKTSTELRVLKADYDYMQLHEWFTRAAPAALAIR